MGKYPAAEALFVYGVFLVERDPYVEVFWGFVLGVYGGGGV